MSLKHITFIRPNIRRMRSTDAMEPLVFAILAGRTPAGIELALYDDRLEEIPYDIDTDLVAMTVETFTARRAYQIAARFRQRGIPVVMGGFHPTLMPEEAGRHCDAVVMGDAEGVWEQVVADAGRGRSFLQRIYRQETPPEMAGLRFERSIFAGKKYAPVALVQYGRGCRFACDFCSIIAFYGRHRTQRPPAEVAEELRALKRKIVLFVDDNLFSDKPSFEALLDAVTPLGIRWVCQITLDIVRHEDLLHKMAKSGCIAVLVGFESLHEENLKQMRKGWNARQDYGRAIKKFQEHGIMIYGTFIFGYDYDSPDDFDRTVEFAIREKFFLANFNPLTPTPGTPLYDRLMAEKRMIYPEWWLDPDYRYGQAVFRPVGLTEEELTGGIYRARNRFFGIGTILRRALLSPGMFLRPYHLWVYGFANLISRIEIRRKQDSPFGDPSPCSPGGGD